MYHRNDEDDEWESGYFRSERECPIPYYWSDSLAISRILRPKQRGGISVTSMHRLASEALSDQPYTSRGELQLSLVAEKGNWRLKIRYARQLDTLDSSFEETDWLSLSLSFLRAYSVTRAERDEKKKGDCTTTEDRGVQYNQGMDGVRERLGVGLWCWVERTRRRETQHFFLLSLTQIDERVCKVRRVAPLSRKWKLDRWETMMVNRCEEEGGGGDEEREGDKVEVEKREEGRRRTSSLTQNYSRVWHKKGNERGKS